MRGGCLELSGTGLQGFRLKTANPNFQGQKPSTQMPNPSWTRPRGDLGFVVLKPGFEALARGSTEGWAPRFQGKIAKPISTRPRGSEDPPWGARFCQGSAAEVVGLHGFETRLRGFDGKTKIRVQRRGVGGRKRPPIGRV